MSYKTIFDVAQNEGLALRSSITGFAFICIGLLFFFARKKLNVPIRYPSLFLAFSILWTCLKYSGNSSDYPALVAALHEGKCQITEGVVTDFKPMPYEGHQNETFVVSGIRFEYSDYNSSAAFNQSASHGGPIKEGLKVRIHHVGNDIVRLEVPN